MISPYGKIPPQVLKKIVYKNLGARRNDVILSPSIGEDAAIVKGGEIFIASSCDPISGASKRLGWLAVNIAANDVATCGVKPLWFNSCLLLPKDFGEDSLEEICSQMNRAAKELDIAIIGGHVEVTPGIRQPIAIGFCLGIIKNKGYFKTGDAKPDHKILLTKGAGIEGTGILALDRGKDLSRLVESELLRKAQKYIDKVSVVKECLLASNHEGVTSMHDPTEGGIAGGLNEMAEASGCGFTVYEEEILVNEETEAICKVFDIDPLRLISSGSLLIAIKSNHSKSLLRKLREDGIPCSIIGEFTEDKHHRIIIDSSGNKTTYKTPVYDELWKALEKQFR